MCKFSATNHSCFYSMSKTLFLREGRRDNYEFDSVIVPSILIIYKGFFLIYNSGFCLTSLSICVQP